MSGNIILELPNAFEVQDEDGWHSVYDAKEISEWADEVQRITVLESQSIEALMNFTASSKFTIIALASLSLLSVYTSIWTFIEGNMLISKLLIGPALSGIVGLYFINNILDKIKKSRYQ